MLIFNQLNHPNIIRAIEYFDDDNMTFIVMELMEGGEMFDKLSQREIYTESYAANIFRQIANAISYCHAMGLVHRDLKVSK